VRAKKGMAQGMGKLQGAYFVKIFEGLKITARIARNNKLETYKIKRFEISNHSRRNSYISFELKDVLADLFALI
jgi:Ran GTPase-activating protein (RanGAP) involved in mRNA processing and transport